MDVSCEAAREEVAIFRTIPYMACAASPATGQLCSRLARSCLPFLAAWLPRLAVCNRTVGRKQRIFSELKTLAKEELLTMEGYIEEILPDGRFAVLLDNEHKIIAYTAGKMRKFRIRSVVGDRVHVEMTPYDLTKGRIVFRERTPGQAGPGQRRGNFRR